MGIMSFIKNAGSKLFSADQTELDAIDVQQVRREAAAAMATESEEKMRYLVSEMGFVVDEFDIDINVDEVRITGQAENQSTREKIVLLLGNTEGIAAVDDQMTVLINEAESKFHTVVSGDTLGKIAKTYYGNAGKYPAIFEANKPMLNSADNIYPGQVLRIPNID